MGNRDWLFQVSSLLELDNSKDQAWFNVSDITLYEFSKMNTSIEVYSEILGCSIWFCSNEETASSLKTENPEAVTYTAEELLELLNLSPGPEDIKRIHNVKSIFPNSVVIESILSTNFNLLKSRSKYISQPYHYLLDL
jgi:hypothetical protein